MNEYFPSFIVEPVLRQARRFSERVGSDEHSAPTDAPSHSRTAPNSPGGVQSPSDVITASNRFGLPNLPQLPAVPIVDFQRFYPTRFWNQSPPPSSEGERKSPDAVIVDESNNVLEESTFQSIARNVQLWASQINNLDVFPSPPLQPVPLTSEMQDDVADQGDVLSMETTEFPPLETEVPQRPPLRGSIPEAPRTRQDLRTDSETSLNPANELSYRSRALDDRNNGRSYSDPLTTPNIGQDLGVTAIGLQDEMMPGRARDWSGSLPEDDGMGLLRKQINAIWSGPETSQEKSRLVHALMTARYRQSQIDRPKPAPVMDASFRPTSPSSISTVSHEGIFNLFPADLQPTYVPASHNGFEDEPTTSQLGCVHYQRNVKMQCDACSKWYTCRLCHDEIEDHQLPRRDTKHMLCMICNTPQAVAQDCRMCGTQAACYYCAVCKLWNNDPAKSIYHCDGCGICRLGEGLGKDFFHCDTCAACMSIQAESTHKCIEKSTKCDCPICGEFMFTSNLPVAFMRCGHSIHEACFADWCNASYKCPICSKSIANMESQFRRLDRLIEEQPMPEEYNNNRAFIFCNDCNSRSVTKYHWLGLKCEVCDSYNTAQLELMGPESPQILERAGQAQQMGEGEAGITASQSRTPAGEMTQPASGANTGQTTPMNMDSRHMVDISTGVDIALSGRARSPPNRRDSPFHVVTRSPSLRSGHGTGSSGGNYFNTGPSRMNSENRRGSYFSVFGSGSARETDNSTSTIPSYMPARDASSRPHTSPADRTSPIRSQTYPLVSGSATSPLALPTQINTHPDDDEDLDFWGGTSPRSIGAELVDSPISDDEAESSDEDDHDRMDEEDDDDDDAEDLMDILGHR